ncbi:MAG: hypothetical protein CVU53_04580 [Deltaproteobacteria bacterium HGW-Deltaproteobacteria-11]|nr:MAG: hypothetical protein CVU53_04580 [Deltaproteobacteria bacterium HGW-Deltaproteobacteria-11]
MTKVAVKHCPRPGFWIKAADGRNAHSGALLLKSPWRVTAWCAVNKTQKGFCVNGFVAGRKNRRGNVHDVGRKRLRLKKVLVRQAEYC